MITFGMWICIISGFYKGNSGQIIEIDNSTLAPNYVTKIKNENVEDIIRFGRNEFKKGKCN